jgi:hypothetical protein
MSSGDGIGCATGAAGFSVVSGDDASDRFDAVNDGPAAWGVAGCCFTGGCVVARFDSADWFDAPGWAALAPAEGDWTDAGG